MGLVYVGGAPVFDTDGLSNGSSLTVGTLLPASDPSPGDISVLTVDVFFQLTWTPGATTGLGFGDMALNLSGFAKSPCFWDWDSLSITDPITMTRTFGDFTNLLAHASDSDQSQWYRGSFYVFLKVKVPPTATITFTAAHPTDPTHVFVTAGSVRMIGRFFRGGNLTGGFPFLPYAHSGSIDHNGFGDITGGPISFTPASGETIVHTLGHGPPERVRAFDGPATCRTSAGDPTPIPPPDGHSGSNTWSSPTGPWQYWDSGLPGIATTELLSTEYDIGETGGQIKLYSALSTCTPGTPYAPTFTYNATPTLDNCGGSGWGARHISYDEDGSVAGLALGEYHSFGSATSPFSCQAVTGPVGILASVGGTLTPSGTPAGTYDHDTTAGISHVRRRTPGLGATSP